MSTCDDVRERLDDFVDGLLDADEAAAVAGHLEGCASCRAEEQALRALLSDAAALADRVAPPRDLWPAIERRLRRDTGAWLRGLAAAAALLLAAGGLLLARTAPAPPASSESARVQGDGTGELQRAALQAEEMARLEAEYEQAAQGLLVQLRSRQDRLPPETVAQVEASLKTIDGALGQIRTALAQKPSEPGLHLMLASTHRKKIDLLRRVVRVGA
jgi:anti-sigma factor RsiW